MRAIFASSTKVSWLPDDSSPKADIHRSHLPDGIRRLFMHLDAMRREGTLPEFLQWLDENNLMNQVSNEYMPSDFTQKPYNLLA